MSDELDKPNEFWLDDLGCDGWFLSAKPLKEFVYHVIDYAEYEKVLSEHKTMHTALLNDGHFDDDMAEIETLKTQLKIAVEALELIAEEHRFLTASEYEDIAVEALERLKGKI